MEKQEILQKYKKAEDKLLISKLFDKIEMCDKTNKIVNSDFLDPAQKNILQTVINAIKLENYKFYGVVENPQRSVLIIYPKKLAGIEINFNTILKTIRVMLPPKMQGTFEHRTYLGGLIKLGIKREKIGDIITYKEGADIVITADMLKYILNNISQLTRFEKCEICEINLKNIHKVNEEFKNLKIIVSSMRLDNIIAELVGTSRNKANEIIMQERVFVNYESETKQTKQIKENDLITIRGKGKYIIRNIEGNTRSGRIVIKVEQFI